LTQLLRRLGVRDAAGVDVGDALAQLLERLVDIDLLALQRVDALGEFLAGVDKLRIGIVVTIETEDLADLGEREADASSAQDQDDARAIALRVDARLAAAFRRA